MSNKTLPKSGVISDYVFAIRKSIFEAEQKIEKTLRTMERYVCSGPSVDARAFVKKLHDEGVKIVYFYKLYPEQIEGFVKIIQEIPEMVDTQFHAVETIFEKGAKKRIHKSVQYHEEIYHLEKEFDNGLLLKMAA